MICENSYIYYSFSRIYGLVYASSTMQYVRILATLLKDKNLRNTLKEKALARANELPDYEEVILQTFDIMKNLVNE